jgi:hypothetical protein
MTTFVYVPVADRGFDEFAAELVAAKNEHHGAGSYRLLNRADARPLSAVQAGDRLYIGIHGSQSGRVYVMQPGSYDDKDVGTLRTGSELARLLIQHGLPKVRLHLYLWVCHSAAPTVNTEAGRAMRAPVVTQVASALRWRGYSQVTVTGYTEEVNISTNVAHTHRTLLTGNFPKKETPTAGHKVTEPARAWWQRAQ